MGLYFGGNSRITNKIPGLQIKFQDYKLNSRITNKIPRLQIKFQDYK